MIALQSFTRVLYPVRGAVRGKFTPIGSGIDHRLMRNIRANVDAVLVGAGTVRSENPALSVNEPLARRRRERDLKEQLLLIILTRNGNIPANRKIFRASSESSRGSPRSLPLARLLQPVPPNPRIYSKLSLTNSASNASLSKEARS